MGEQSRGLAKLFGRRRRAKEVAESIATRSSIKDTSARWYKKSSTKVGNLMTDLLSRELGSLEGTRLLDFGSGTGRVAIPFAQLNKHASVTCVDVDAEAIEYITLTAPSNVVAQVGPYLPPLPFGDEAFDGVWAVSVWSHFPEKLGTDWLAELRRITRPGAALVISFSGLRSLDRLKSKSDFFASVTAETLLRDGFLYEEYRGLKSSGDAYPGIAGEGSWGRAVIHPDYIEQEWSELFEVVGFDRLPGDQDVAILRRPH